MSLLVVVPKGIVLIIAFASPALGRIDLGGACRQIGVGFDRHEETGLSQQMSMPTLKDHFVRVHAVHRPRSQLQVSKQRKNDTCSEEVLMEASQTLPDKI
jgi:hypothetical protein